MSIDEVIPTEEILHQDTWEQDLLQNYIENLQENEAETQLTASEEADDIINENIEAKTKSEIRQYIEDIELYVLQNIPSIAPEFSAFKASFIERSIVEKKQMKISNYFKSK